MNEPDFPWVGQDYRAALTTQRYGQRPLIDGVSLVDLSVFGDEGGDFCELARFMVDGSVEALPAFRPKQMSYSSMEPGAIKAWHVHENQDDLWFVQPHDRALVGLLDIRNNSPSYGESMRFTLGAGRARLLLIPRGVAHGIANLGNSRISVIYFASSTFDAQIPDEHRLPFDILGEDFWTVHAE